MLDWTDEQKMLREAIRSYVDNEIVPLRDELEHGDLPPYDVLRKMFTTFGIDEMARDGFNRRLERDVSPAHDVVRDPVGIAALGLRPGVDADPADRALPPLPGHGDRARRLGRPHGVGDRQPGHAGTT